MPNETIPEDVREDARSIGYLVRDWMTGPDPLSGDKLEQVIAKRLQRLAADRASRATGAVRVKPMEWADVGEGPRCITVCGTYAIHPASGSYGKPMLRLTGMPGDLFGKFATVDEAKAAAQADYEKRVLSALAAAPAAPQPEANADVEALEYAARVLENARDFCGQHRTDEKMNKVSAFGVDAAIIKLRAIIAKHGGRT